MLPLKLFSQLARDSQSLTTCAVETYFILNFIIGVFISLNIVSNWTL